LVLLIEEIYEARVEVASCGMMFMKIGTGVQALLRGCLRNLKGWNIISDGRDL
jgi:hypothetical protein